MSQSTIYKCDVCGAQSMKPETWLSMKRDGYTTPQFTAFSPTAQEYACSPTCATTALKQWTEELRIKYEALQALLNTPETEDFDKGVVLEAAHQVQRWSAAEDEGKQPEDWLWLLGYLAGKALAAVKAGDDEKARHHCISAAAVLRNWHSHIATGHSAMRPGIGKPPGL
jgi:hypothetical protein